MPPQLQARSQTLRLAHRLQRVKSGLSGTYARHALVWPLDVTGSSQELAAAAKEVDKAVQEQQPFVQGLDTLIFNAGRRLAWLPVCCRPWSSTQTYLLACMHSASGVSAAAAALQRSHTLHCAGASQHAAIEQTQPQVMEALLALNLQGALHLIRASLPLMLDRCLLPSLRREAALTRPCNDPCL